MRPSRPITIFVFLPDEETSAFVPPAMILAKAAVNFIISTGVKLFPELPPIVPLIPYMLLISATLCCFLFNGQ